MENKNSWKLQFKANVIASFKQLEKIHLSPTMEKEKLHFPNVVPNDCLMYSKIHIYFKTLQQFWWMDNLKLQNKSLRKLEEECDIFIWLVVTDVKLPVL